MCKTCKERKGNPLNQGLRKGHPRNANAYVKVCVCVCVRVCVCVCVCACVCGSTYAYTCAKNRSVYYAMVSDAPTTLGLKPRNEKVLEYNVTLKPAEGVESWLLEKNGEYWQDIQMIQSGSVGPLLFDWPNQEQHDDRKGRLHAKKASHCAIVPYGVICNLAINGAFTLNSLNYRSLSQRHSNTKECNNTPSVNMVRLNMDSGDQDDSEGLQFSISVFGGDPKRYLYGVDSFPRCQR